MSPSHCLSILADDNFNPTRPPCTLRQFSYSFNFDSKLFTLRRILHLFWAPNPNNNLKENQLNWWKRIGRYHCDIHEIALRLLFFSTKLEFELCVFVKGGQRENLAMMTRWSIIENQQGFQPTREAPQWVDNLIKSILWDSWSNKIKIKENVILWSLLLFCLFILLFHFFLIWFVHVFLKFKPRCWSCCDVIKFVYFAKWSVLKLLGPILKGIIEWLINCSLPSSMKAMKSSIYFCQCWNNGKRAIFLS